MILVSRHSRRFSNLSARAASQAATPAGPSSTRSESPASASSSCDAEQIRRPSIPSASQLLDRAERGQVTEVVAGEDHLPGTGLDDDVAQRLALVHAESADLQHALARLEMQAVALGEVGEGSLELVERVGRDPASSRVCTPMARPLFSSRTPVSPRSARSPGISSGNGRDRRRSGRDDVLAGAGIPALDSVLAEHDQSIAAREYGRTAELDRRARRVGR